MAFLLPKFCHWSYSRKPSSGQSSALPRPWHFTGLIPACLCRCCTGEPRTGPSIPEMSHWDWTGRKDHLSLSPANALLAKRAFLDFFLTKRKSKPTKTLTHQTNKQVFPFFLQVFKKHYIVCNYQEQYLVNCNGMYSQHTNLGIITLEGIDTWHSLILACVLCI